MYIIYTFNVFLTLLHKPAQTTSRAAVAVRERKRAPPPDALTKQRGAREGRIRRGKRARVIATAPQSARQAEREGEKRRTEEEEGQAERSGQRWQESRRPWAAGRLTAARRGNPVTRANLRHQYRSDAAWHRPPWSFWRLWLVVRCSDGEAQ